MKNCRLYLVSPPKIELEAFASQLEQALDAGDVGAFQLRLKEANDDTIIQAVQALLPICHAQDVAFILNDRADLAKELGVDGVHLGQDDMPVAEAREILPNDMVIGATCHASRDLGMVAGEAGADYVAFGAFYPTTSKPPEKVEKWGVPEPDILSWWQEYLVLPCVAIGGITPDNCAPLVAAGADFVAAITSVWDHPEGPATAVKAFNEAINAAQSTRAA